MQDRPLQTFSASTRAANTEQTLAKHASDMAERRLEMNVKTKAIIAGTAIVLILGIAAGLRIQSFSRKRAQSAQSVNPFALAAQPGAAMPDMSEIVGNQANLLELMTKSKMKPRLANYISTAQLQVVSQTDTSVHLVITYADKSTIDENITVDADPSYTPGPVDLERAARTGSKVHGPKLTVKRKGPNQWEYMLQYHVPYSAIPSDLLQKIQSSGISQRTNAGFHDWVPPVYADGGLAAGEGVVSILANYFATYYDKMWEMEKKSVGVDVPLALLDLGDDILTLKGWMSEIGELEDCAKNPTNPLSQKASHDPNYQHDVLDPLNDAKGDVESTLVPTLASDTAGFVTHWLPFGSGAVVGLIFSTQDEAISQYAEGRIEEAGRYVVPCHHEQLTAGQFRPMQGNLTYSYKSSTHDCRDDKCVQGDVDRQFEGSAQLTSDSSGYLGGKGVGEFKITANQRAWDRYCKSSGWHQDSKGAGEIDLLAGGTPLDGVIRATLKSNSLALEGESTTCSGSKVPYHQENGWLAVSCEFHNVDLVHGGTFSAFETGDSHGTCKLEISPQ